MPPRNKASCKAHRRTRTTGKAPPPSPEWIADNAARLHRELYRIGPNGTGKHTRRLLAEAAKARRPGDIITRYGPARLTYGPTGGPILHISGWIIHGPPA